MLMVMKLLANFTDMTLLQLRHLLICNACVEISIEVFDGPRHLFQKE